MKKTILWSLLLCLGVVLAGCGKEEKSIPVTTVPETTIAATENAKIPDVLEGEWIAGGIVSKGNIISFSQNDALADLYDSNWVIFMMMPPIS